MKKFSEMPMPSKKDKKQADSEGFDLFASEEETPTETDMADSEEAPEMEMEDAASPLAEISDDELLAEFKKRGLSLDSSESEV